MTTPTPSVAVVATTLPTIDRRALSEAWYRALHLAERGGRPSRTVPAPRRSPAPLASATLPRAASDAAGSSPGAPARPQRSTSAAPRAAGGTRDAAFVRRTVGATAFAARLERVAERAAVARKPASVAIALDDGRVHVLVRTSGATTRIVALCAPALRERVDAALAQTRLALAQRGARPGYGA